MLAAVVGLILYIEKRSKCYSHTANTSCTSCSGKEQEEENFIPVA